MEDEMIFEIKIYEWDKDGSRYHRRPRRINDGEYHIEWHRKGIEFKQCPEGNIHHPDGMIQDIHVMFGKLVRLQKQGAAAPPLNCFLAYLLLSTSFSYCLTTSSHSLSTGTFCFKQYMSQTGPKGSAL